MSELDIRTTATVGGKKTNRVKLQGKRGRPVARQHKPTEPSPQRALARFRKDPSVAGKLYTVVAISLPVDDLATIDERAASLRMSRSEYLRRAAMRPTP